MRSGATGKPEDRYENTHCDHGADERSVPPGAKSAGLMSEACGSDEHAEDDADEEEHSFLNWSLPESFRDALMEK